MRMQKKKFRIGELAEQLNVEPFVVRFWEKEFNVRIIRSCGGQRFYSEKDLTKLKFIKELLYNQGFTIAGAKKKLSEINPQENHNLLIPCKKTEFNQSSNHLPNKDNKSDLTKQIAQLKNHLRKLRELL